MRIQGNKRNENSLSYLASRVEQQRLYDHRYGTRRHDYLANVYVVELCEFEAIENNGRHVRAQLFAQQPADSAG
jgi:hypothetical protein